jgi:hypothetical protein
LPALPSHIPRYDSVDLLDLDQLPYEIAVRPAAATLQRAWAKLEEVERRWTMFDWATFVVPHTNRNTSLLRDFAGAYLLSFESTLQVLLIERRFSNFDGWLQSQSAYDLACRGLRTLRHQEAHIRVGDLSLRRDASVASRFAHTTTGGTVPWRWSSLEVKDLAALDNPKITPPELPQWNQLCEDKLTLGLMRHGIQSLRTLLVAAGP